MPFASNWYPFNRPPLVSFQRPLTLRTEFLLAPPPKLSAVFLKGFRRGCVKPGRAKCFDGFSTIMLALIGLVLTWNVNTHEPMAGNERKSDIADT